MYRIHRLIQKRVRSCFVSNHPRGYRRWCLLSRHSNKLLIRRYLRLHGFGNRSSIHKNHPLQVPRFFGRMRFRLGKHQCQANVRHRLHRLSHALRLRFRIADHFPVSSLLIAAYLASYRSRYHHQKTFRSYHFECNSCDLYLRLTYHRHLHLRGHHFLRHR